MRMYQDLSFKEISELTGVSITALGRQVICDTKFEKNY